jgi:LPS-assembly lipoprotein
MWWPSPSSFRGAAKRRTRNPEPRSGVPLWIPGPLSFRDARWAFVRFLPVLALTSLLAGCFEPLYGEKTLAGGPGLRQRLSAVDVETIKAPSGSPQARLAVELRNDLIFDLTGGSGGTGATHTLKIEMSSSVQQVIVDNYTARADVQQFGINVTYSLIEIATGKSVVTGQTFARVAFDNPGQQQRFANARGLRDAEDRAARTIADHIKSRLASYFSAGA